jgi:hypothetical protein
MSLSKAIKELKENSTPEEYKTLLESMFLALSREGKRKTLRKEVKFTSVTKNALFKKR